MMTKLFNQIIARLELCVYIYEWLVCKLPRHRLYISVNFCTLTCLFDIALVVVQRCLS